MLRNIIALVFSAGPLYPKLLALIQWVGSRGKWSPSGVAESIRGVSVRGNRRAPRTRWWNHWRLALGGGWDRWVVLRVEETPYLAGYRPTNGHHPMIWTVPLASPLVAFQVGREPVDFFALNPETLEEIPLVVIKNPRGKPLHYKGELPHTGITLL